MDPMYYDESSSLWKMIIVIAIFGAIICVPFTVLGLKDVFQAGASRDWPVTSGKITHSEIVSSERMSTSSSSRRREYSVWADVRYEYYVDGEPFTGDNIQFGGVSNAEIAKQEVNKYPIGKEVDVYYDPIDNNNSVLEPGYSLEMLFGPLMGLGGIAILSFVIFVIWYVGIREKKDEEPVKSPYNF